MNPDENSLFDHDEPKAGTAAHANHGDDGAPPADDDGAMIDPPAPSDPAASHTEASEVGEPVSAPLVDREALLEGLIEPRPEGAPDLSAASLDELQAEWDRRQRTVAKLLREKDRLRARLVEIDREVAQLSPTPGAPSEAVAPPPVAVTYRKPLSDLTVAEAVARVFEIGEEFSPSDATERLLDGGFQTRASNFRQIVSQTLSREMRFKRVSHGRYQRTA